MHYIDSHNMTKTPTQTLHHTSAVSQCQMRIFLRKKSTHFDAILWSEKILSVVE